MEFVEEWFIEQTLGEGAFGEVKLLVNKKTKDEVALKIVNLQHHPNAADTVRKEIQIHKLLDHENIIRFYGSRKEGPTEYLFLEYASGGEIFDRIEPDFGVLDQAKAQLWFKQIISGVDYLHERGVAHRDLKPENILLDSADNVKITDFGLATVFRIRGTERLLEKRCGTLPYVAPEVLKGQYKATPADIWSCGIILVALLAGELPWDKATPECPEYAQWKNGDTCRAPWNKLDIKALGFAKRLLCPSASRRITMEQIRTNPWMCKKAISYDPYRKKQMVLISGDSKVSTGSQLAKKIASGLNLSDKEDDSITRLCLSQPAPWMGCAPDTVDGCEPTPAALQQRLMFSFSQPAAPHIDDFYLNSQLGSPSSTQSPPISRWVKRLTRICVTTSVDASLKELTNILDDFGYSHKVQRSGIACVTISTSDRRKNVLTYKAHVIEMGNKMVLLDFRLSRGDGLEFKRHFVRIKEKFAKYEWKGPMAWIM